MLSVMYPVYLVILAFALCMSAGFLWSGEYVGRIQAAWRLLGFLTCIFLALVFVWFGGRR